MLPTVHRAGSVPAALMGGVSAPFNPASISGLRSRLLDANTFTSPINSKYYLKDSSTTNTHLPRQGRAWLFDGTNDYATRGARVTSGAVSAMTLSGWVSRTGASVMMLLTEAGSGTSGWHVQLNSSAGGDIRLYFPDNTSFGVTASGLISTSALTHFAIVFDGSGSLNTDRLKIYINGSLASLSFTGTIPSSIASHANSFDVGAFNSGGGQFFNRSIRDVRIYNVAKTAGEVTSIYNQSSTGSGTFDTTGLLAAYPCNEESGTTGYDISGNGKHLTLTNITQATFHATDTGVLANRNNSEGYRLSGSVYIPKRLSDSLAADGNALTVTGRAAYHGCAETPCVTNHTGTVYIAAAHLAGTETVVSFSGSTTTPTISAGRIDWQSGQTLSDLTLSDGTRYTMQEGPGSSNTNRTIYNVNGSTNHGTLTNGTVATIWGTRLAGTVQDWCILYGGRIGAAGEFVPGRVSGGLASDGSAKTLTAGKFGNPFSRLNLNPATAAELNGRSVPTAAAAGADINATITPTDSAFRRTASDGDDRILIYDATLSGADLSNVEGYVV